MVMETPEHQVNINTDIQQCFNIESKSRSIANTPKPASNDESMTL